MGSDYRYARQQFQDRSIGGFIAVGTSGTIPLVPAKAKHTVYVQRIVVHITTSAAQNWSFRATTTTTAIAGFIPNSAAAGATITIDYGDAGLPLPNGEGLELALSAAGVVGSYEVTAYQKLTPGVSITAAALQANL